jgi:hypothetical protein
MVQVREIVALDAVVIWTPVHDAFFDGFGFKILGDSLTAEGWEFVVGGEAERDELARGELGDEVVFLHREQGGEAKTLLKTNDAVLGLEGAATAIAGDQYEDDSHDDPPEMEVWLLRPVVDGDVDGEGEVEQQKRHQDEVEDGIEAGVVLIGLRDGHGRSFRLAQ